LVRGARVGQRVVAPRADLGEEVARTRHQRPRVAAQVAEIDDERLDRFLAEDVLRALEVARVDGARLQLRRRAQRLEIRGTDPDERGIEARGNGLARAQEFDLALFSTGNWR